MRAPPPEAIIARGLSLLEQSLDEGRPGWEADLRLVQLAQRLSEGFTSERPATTPAATDDVAHAYLAYFAPRTLAAVAAALEGTAVPERVVDVGAGTGAAALAFAIAGARELVLVDHDARALERAKKLLEQMPERPRVTTVAADLHAGAPVTTTDATVASAFTLGELNGEAGADEVWRLLQQLAPASPRFFLVDAGDHRRARRLQDLRAAALSSDWHIGAPCPHQDVCPALERRRDWCHLRAPRLLTPRLARFAELVGRDPLAVSYSFVDVRREARTDERKQLLVIGEPRKEKGRVRLPVCGEGGLRFLQALKRDRAAYDALLRAQRGDKQIDPGFSRRGDTGHVDEAVALRVDGEDAKLPP